jgi:GT2 family glycosyltransferase
MSLRALSLQLVFANYQCADDIQRCIDSLVAAAGSARLDVVVVNNGGPRFKDETPDVAAQVVVRAVDPGSNLGYFGAFRAAIDADLDGRSYDFRILCNPDIEFHDSSFFDVLARQNIDARTGLLAPTVVSGVTHKDQNPFLESRPAALKRLGWRAAYLCLATYVTREWLSARSRDNSHGPLPNANSTRPASSRPIYAAHGAFLVFTDAFLRHARGALSQVPFLYAEELFIGEICRHEGWSITYTPELQVYHREHAVTGTLASRARYRLKRDAVLAYLKFARAQD